MPSFFLVNNDKVLTTRFPVVDAVTQYPSNICRTSLSLKVHSSVGVGFPFATHLKYDRVFCLSVPGMKEKVRKTEKF